MCVTKTGYFSIAQWKIIFLFSDDVIAGSVLGGFFALLAARYMYAASVLKTAAVATADNGGNMAVAQNLAGNTNDIALVP